MGSNRLEQRQLGNVFELKAAQGLYCLLAPFSAQTAPGEPLASLKIGSAPSSRFTGDAGAGAGELCSGGASLAPLQRSRLIRTLVWGACLRQMHSRCPCRDPHQSLIVGSMHPPQTQGN